MKKVLKFFMYSAMAVAVVAACTKDPVTNADDKKPGEENPGNTDQPDAKADRELEEASLEATPVGDTLTFDLTADAAWTIAADECDWITVEPASGEAGEATVTFYVEPNQDGKDRSVSFFVNAAETETHKAGDIYEVFISQVKMEYSVAEKDMAFLQWMIDNKVYGDATPSPDWFNFNPEGFVGLSFGQDAAGKWFVQAVDFRASAETPSSTLFNSFPPTMDLPNLERIYINCTHDGINANTPSAMNEEVKCALKGSEFPTEWNTPALRQCHLECTGMQGVIPASFAETTPGMVTLFFRHNDFYGALPQKWAAKGMEQLALTYLGRAWDCPNMGYLVPAEADCILNSEKDKNHGLHNDWNIIQYGGQVTDTKDWFVSAQWKGFENGWGQKRYERFDPAAVAGKKDVWSDYRPYTNSANADEVANGGLRNPNNESDGKYIDAWGGWYHCVITAIPHEMHEWNQADADAFTAEMAKRARIFTR